MKLSSVPCWIQLDRIVSVSLKFIWTRQRVVCFQAGRGFLLFVWKQKSISLPGLENFNSAAQVPCASLRSAAQLRLHLEPLNTIVQWCQKGFEDPSIWLPWCHTQISWAAAVRLIVDRICIYFYDYISSYSMLRKLGMMNASSILRKLVWLMLLGHSLKVAGRASCSKLTDAIFYFADKIFWFNIGMLRCYFIII